MYKYEENKGAYILVLTLLLLVFAFIFVSVFDNDSHSNKIESSVDTCNLTVNNTYRVLDIREFASSRGSYGGKFNKTGLINLVIVVEDVDSKERCSVVLNVNYKYISDNEDFKSMSLLVKDDVFTYKGDYKYDLVKEE